jgi:hypothetical protein
MGAACPLVVLLLAGLLLAAAPAGATILLFDQERDAATRTTVYPASSGGSLPPDYGGHVTGAVMAVPGGFFTYGDGGEGFTPDVSVNIFSAAATATDARVNLWQNGYGDLVNVIFAEGPGIGGAPLLSVRLTAAPGYSVDLYGFDLAGFGADYVIAGVSVFAGATTLFSEADVLVQGDLSGPRHTSFAFATPLSGPELLVEVDLSNLDSGIQDNVGMDSVRFGQTPPRTVPEPTTALLLGALALAAAARRWRSATRLVRHVTLLGALLGAGATGAGAATIGTPVIDLRIWGITSAENSNTLTGPGLHGPILEFATELDLVNGGVVRSAQIGNASNGDPVYAEAGVADDGDTFWVLTDTPNHFQNANRDYIGSEAVVRIYQSYTKDSEDASLTYTYSRAQVGAFISAEYGPQCQPGEIYCLRAGMISLVEVYDAAGSAIGADFNKALMWSNGTPFWDSVVDGGTAWPWEIEQSGVGGFLEYSLRLSQPVTNEIDLSDVALNQEFTVVYTLWAYALDTSADAGLFRTAEAFARDPLGGSTGVSFDLVGLTPTNNPSVLPVPEPAAGWLLGAALASLAPVARRAQRGRCSRAASSARERTSSLR